MKHEEPGVIPVTKYAKLRGLSYTAIALARKSGRLHGEAIRISPTGRFHGIVPELADQQLADNTDQERSETGSLRPGDYQPASGVDSLPPNPGTYAEHRAARERYNAELTRIELLEKLGLTVSTEDVSKAADQTARRVKEALLVIPDRICSLVAAETDTGRVHAILSNEIRQALHALAGAATHTT